MRFVCRNCVLEHGLEPGCSDNGSGTLGHLAEMSGINPSQEKGWGARYGARYLTPDFPRSQRETDAPPGLDSKAGASVSASTAIRTENVIRLSKLSFGARRFRL